MEQLNFQSAIDALNNIQRAINEALNNMPESDRQKVMEITKAKREEMNKILQDIPAKINELKNLH